MHNDIVRHDNGTSSTRESYLTPMPLFTTPIKRSHIALSILIISFLLLLIPAATAAPALQTATAQMNIDAPTQGQTLRGPMTIRGWAFDRAAGGGNGPGINLIRVYGNSSTCSGAIVGETAPNIARSDVTTVFGLDPSYINSGFAIPYTHPYEGGFTFTVCARSSVTGQFVRWMTRSVTVRPVLLQIDSPPANAGVRGAFTISGWAVNFAAPSNAGPGVDIVRAYAGSVCSGTLLGQGSVNLSRPDVRAAYGLPTSFTNSGYAFSITPPSAGLFTFTVCARSTLTGQFMGATTRTVNVQAGMMHIDAPANGATVGSIALFRGWAINPAAGTGNGPGINLISVYQGTGCTGNLLGQTPLNVSRPDVSAAFGLDSSYNLSGFSLYVIHTGGTQQFTICARGTQSNQIDAQVTLTLGNSTPAMQQEMLNLVNNQRCAIGAPPVSMNAALNAASQRHSNDMAYNMNSYISHTGTDGSSPASRALQAGYSYTALAENIAAGYPTVSDVFQGWWNSTGHRSNMLNTNYREMGLALTMRSGTVYTYYWTQMFGNRVGAPTAACPSQMAAQGVPMLNMAGSGSLNGVIGEPAGDDRVHATDGTRWPAVPPMPSPTATATAASVMPEPSLSPQPTDIPTDTPTSAATATGTATDVPSPTPTETPMPMQPPTEASSPTNAPTSEPSPPPESTMEAAPPNT